MARIIALDYGAKRVGVAVTDPLQIIANGLTTVNTKDIWNFLEKYISKEKVDCIVVGYPLQMSGEGSQSLKFINPFVKKLKEKYHLITIELADERFTSKIAQQTMLDAGLKKKDRQDKALVDTISATIILQGYLDYRKNKRN